MNLNLMRTLSKACLLIVFVSATVAAQDTRVEVAKRSRIIPRACESVEPAAIPNSGLAPIDVPALAKEAICKGSGDMIADYTYTVNSSRRQKDKKGKTKEETTTFEVFFPTLKSGTRTKGVLVVTSRNGIAVPPEELEKERMKAAERIEKEEEKIARSTPTAARNSDTAKGMLPLGMYTHTSISRSAFGVKTAGAGLAIDYFLRTCEVTAARREQIEGRETIVFNFVPRPNAQFVANQKYIASLTGEIWIDAQDHIVTRLIGWPSGMNTTSKATSEVHPVASSTERPPAVYVEMMRVREGFWLPRTIRINGADYPTLFDGITADYTSNYSNYIRFTTEIKDVNVTPPSNP